MWIRDESGSKCSLFGRLIAGSLAVVCLQLAAGCGPGMDRIDRRLADVLGDSAAGAGLASAPRIQPAGTIPPSHGSMYQPTPATTNPKAGDLNYTELDRGQPGTPEVVQGLNERLRNYARTAGGFGSDNVLTISLTDALRLAQRQGREYLTAEESYIIDAIGVLTERHRWGPRLFADSSATVGGDGDEGRFDNAVSVVNSLRATQRLPYGGEAEARWVWNATEQLRSSVTGQYQQSSALVLDASIPLLRGAGMVARESLIQSERDLVYAARDFEGFRRSYFVSIAEDYFRLLQTVTELQNRLRQIERLEWLVRQRQATYDAGRINEFDVNQTRNDLLNARSSLASSREQYTLQVDRFKLRLGIPIEQPVRLVGANITIPEPSTTIEAATESALTYRLDLQNRRDQFIDAERGTRNARDDLLADLDFSGQIRIPTDPDVSEGGLAIDPDEASWEAGLTLSLPLDRRIERLALRQSLIRLEQSRRSLSEFTDDVVLDARRRVREIDLARFQLELDEASVALNLRRLEEQNLKIDEVDTDDQLRTQTDLLNAQNRRSQSLTNLRIAILNYLDAVGQLRVSPDGLIDPLPGMTIEIVDTPIDFEALFAEGEGGDSPTPYGQPGTDQPAEE